MAISKTVKVLDLPENIEQDESFTKFGKPVDENEIRYLPIQVRGAAHRAEHCLGWIWRQWLSGNPREVICERVHGLVKKGLDLRARTRGYDDLPVHDLFLINCAILGSTEEQVKEVADAIADASGDKGRHPTDRGELYTAAWSGMMKYWVLGDLAKAQEQSEMIWGAYRHRRVKAASKPLVTPWLKKDWAKFAKVQQKDFDQLWAGIRKGTRWSIKSETDTEIVMTTDNKQIGHMWCWSPCGLAILAKRAGAEIITDPYWFPEVAVR